ncbi:MAG: YqgE/AlgH family protein [Pseudomonadota bacterium]
MTETDDAATGPDELDLAGQLLIAMPGMGDPRFDKAVIYICAHSDNGAMGIIVNKPAEDLHISDLLEQLDIKTAPEAEDIRVMFGGPVDHGRGFVLHTADYGANDSTLAVDAGMGMTATLDILEDIARGNGPAESMLALGYSGWGPGQLEGELAANGWLICPSSKEIVFGEGGNEKWIAALKSIGIDPLLLSSEGGRA